ncbi:MAG TPA: divalent cation transporter [Gammaproteobacteria bacterium]|nr:divalent cation transporter [Gammaproteobacteria bacterium]
MEEIFTIFLYTLGAGLCIPLGGLFASIERIRPNWLENELRHFIIAFGGGVLLAAVAFVLAPEGNRYLDGGPLIDVSILLAGGISFFLLERLLGTRKREKPQFSAMLLDYLPESLALGGAFALGAKSAPLLAVFIGLQNLPEGFNAYRELLATPNASKKRTLIGMFLLTPLGPAFAFAGWIWLSNHPAIIGAVMIYASGGILYLIFQDIAPQSHMRRHWAPPLGAVFGFALGMLGTNYTTGF